MKVKKICTGVPSLIGAENKGTKDNPGWYYKFKVDSNNYKSVEMLLHPKEFSSNVTFSKSILNKIPIIFTGTKGDFELFIRSEMEGFDFSGYH
ncbi:hypothetical protein [Candidatus Thiosymbion oneisti]|nr:hypothetical protein [Candidatus Thiosymbion oneisti]